MAKDHTFVFSSTPFFKRFDVNVSAFDNHGHHNHAIRQLEPSLAPESQAGPTIVGGVRCSVDSSGEVTIVFDFKHVIFIVSFYCEWYEIYIMIGVDS